MTQRFLPLLFGGLLAAPASAASLCDYDDDALLWKSCGEGPRVELILLPEDAGLTPADALDLTGVYTAEDERPEGRPKPVGLFVRAGVVVSREYVRFDGVLTIGEEGRPAISHRRRARFAGAEYDLEDADARAAFIAAAAVAGASVAQSHLLVVDGEIDAFPHSGAPSFRRRILMQGADGSFAVYDSSPRALTLAEATEEIVTKFAPEMALNLDMGSYDFCSRGGERCGALAYTQTGKLSNILRFH